MYKEEKNIDFLFKKQLDEFECSPADASWRFLRMRMQHSALKKNIIKATSAVFVLVISVLSFYLFSNENVATVKYKQTENIESLFIDSVNHRDLKEELFHQLHEAHQQEYERVSEFYIQAESYDLKSENKQLQLIQSNVNTIVKRAEPKKEFLIHKSRLDYLNSAYDDYAPVINPNSNFIYFTSRRPITKKEIRRGEGKERIYYSEREGGNWTNPKLAKAPLNSKNSFNSAVYLAQDEQTIFIYRDNAQGNGDVFASSLKNGTWSEPEPLPEPINSEFHESTVSISSDGSKLFFTSDRPGGEGGLDIWYTEKNKSGIWSEAKNLGPNINSNQHEEGLFLHPNDKTLFFSSKRAGGYGGYDIYYTTYEDGEWSEPTNLGASINTVNDDVYFMMDASNSDAFLTSSTHAGSQKELFTFNWSDDILKKDKTQGENSKIKGEIKYTKNKSGLNNTVSLFLLKNHQIINKEILKENLAFELVVETEKDYELVIFKEGSVPVFEELSRENLKKNLELTQNIELTNIKAEASFVFKVLGRENKELESIDRLFVKQIIDFLNKNKTLQIEVISNEDTLYLQQLFEQEGRNKEEVAGRLIFKASKRFGQEKENLIQVMKII